MPLISCLCVSKPSRFGQLQRAIVDFTTQSYADKELIIVVDNASDFSVTVQSYVDTVRQRLADAPDIWVLKRLCKSQADGLTFAATYAVGDVLALWDDDNRNHPERLSVQALAQEAGKDKITALTNGLYLFHKDAQMIAVALTDLDVKLSRRVLPTTMMAYRRYFPVIDGMTRTTPSSQMLDAAARSGAGVSMVSTPTPLHVVGVTYDNLRGVAFHRDLAQTQAQSETWLSENESAVTAALDAMTWDSPFVVDGQAGGFKYTPKKTWTDLFSITLDPPAKESK